MSSHNADGSPLPRGSVRIHFNTEILDATLDLVASLLEDPTNSFAYPSNEPWTDPMKLLEAVSFAYYQVCLRTTT